MWLNAQSCGTRAGISQKENIPQQLSGMPIRISLPHCAGVGNKFSLVCLHQQSEKNLGKWLRQIITLKLIREPRWPLIVFFFNYSIFRKQRNLFTIPFTGGFHFPTWSFALIWTLSTSKPWASRGELLMFKKRRFGFKYSWSHKATCRKKLILSGGSQYPHGRNWVFSSLMEFSVVKEKKKTPLNKIHFQSLVKLVFFFVCLLKIEAENEKKKLKISVSPSKPFSSEKHWLFN